ncbi:hypothetical protein HMPREF1292_01516 [Corynebacterium sp. KPL1995]|nr:hypothetical protein HMPREF1292_01516 [Corynebacterium sp. KPL1995]ERS71688.1 hypothetical protein HMPREF1290_01522 [Corynebacterium sp. KPL1989]
MIRIDRGTSPRVVVVSNHRPNNVVSPVAQWEPQQCTNEHPREMIYTLQPISLVPDDLEQGSLQLSRAAQPRSSVGIAPYLMGVVLGLIMALGVFVGAA